MELCIGPMSREIIEAVFRYSVEGKIQDFVMREKERASGLDPSISLTLIASKNQIDYDGGYVEGWTTQQYMGFIKDLRKKYEYANVMIARDHCGPGFKAKFLKEYGPLASKTALEDVRQTIQVDLESGFDGIHIDFCKVRTREEMLKQSAWAIGEVVGTAERLGRSVILEVGTDENEADEYTDRKYQEIVEDINFFSALSIPPTVLKYYVVRTGTIVKEMDQVGNLKMDWTRNLLALLHDHNLKLKEHNADYLTKSQIRDHRSVVDAMNIAPQLGVVQTLWTLSTAKKYGIDCKRFLENAYNSGMWKKWLLFHSPLETYYCGILAGHYVFYQDEYKSILEQVKAEEGLDGLYNSIRDIFDLYLNP